MSHVLGSNVRTVRTNHQFQIRSTKKRDEQKRNTPPTQRISIPSESLCEGLRTKHYPASHSTHSLRSTTLYRVIESITFNLYISTEGIKLFLSPICISIYEYNKHIFTMRTITLLLLQLFTAVTTTLSFVVVTPSTLHNSRSSSLYQSAVIEDGTSTSQEAAIPVEKIRYVMILCTRFNVALYIYLHSFLIFLLQF